MLKIPEFKKTISAFLLGEEGSISKKSLIKAGLLAASAAILSDDSFARCGPGGSGHISYWGPQPEFEDYDCGDTALGFTLIKPPIDPDLDRGSDDFHGSGTDRGAGHGIHCNGHSSHDNNDILEAGVIQHLNLLSLENSGDTSITATHEHEILEGIDACGDPHISWDEPCNKSEGDCPYYREISVDESD